MQTRRDTLKQTASLAGLLASLGFPQFVLAANNSTAFTVKSVSEAVKLQGGASLVESKEVSIKGPDIAENGAVVALTAASSLTNVKHLLVLVEKNPAPLVASFEVIPEIEADFSIRAKMGQTSDVYAVAITSEGKAFFAKKEVKVTLGGCGG